MMMSTLPAGGDGAGAGGGLIDGIGGDHPLSVGTLGAGNGGSFVSGLSAIAPGGSADEEEDDQAIFAKIFQEVSGLGSFSACC